MESNNMKAMREALEDVTSTLQEIYDAFCKGSGGVYKSDVLASLDKANAALSRPARICDKMDRHKAIYDCRTWLMRHGYRLSSHQDDIMCQTIYWLYDETKEAEVKYG